MFKSVFISIPAGLLAISLLNACGNNNSEQSIRKKVAADSIRRADSLEKNKASTGNLRHSLEDSILAAKEFEEQVIKYDSLRNLDSLKVKRKKRHPIKSAPNRELWAKSPIK